MIKVSLEIVFIPFVDRKAERLLAMALTSDSIFQRITDGVKENIEKAKAVKGVFLYKITKNGQVAKEWSKL